MQVDIGLREAGLNCTTDQLLQKLESRGFLTGYQVKQVERGEWDTLVIGNFKLLYRNAAGSFARVYRAVDLRNGKMVGLKLLRQRWLKDPAALRDFAREAEMCKALIHENIVPIYDIGRQGDQHYFTMEFIEGGNLRDFLDIRKKLSPKEAAKCVLDIAQGLSYALGKGVTHRDMKLTNVLMSTSGVAKLVDFGLGGVTDESKGDAGESLQRAIEYGTLEKNTGAPRNDPRSDLYFLGVIYYELLTGEPPYARTRDRSERGQFSRYQNVRSIREVDPTLPEAACRIVERLMQLNPNLRYQTPGEAVPDLQAAVAELPGAAVETTRPVAPTAPKGPLLPTVMCIESRMKQQDMLREYFTKHKFRVLVLSDLQRGLLRVRSNPPDSVVVMAEGLGEDSLQGFSELQAANGTLPMVLVVPEKHMKWADQIRQTPSTRVLLHPTLRDIRKAIGALRAQSDEQPFDDSPADEAP